MERQYTRSANVKSMVGIAFAGLGLFVLIESLGWAANPLKYFLWNTGVRILPCMALTAWQAMQAYGLHQHSSLTCLLQMLLSFWPLLLVMARAV
jgi:hypothetical protein